jgi:ribonucleoside-diphosphate reductase alpha chain
MLSVVKRDGRREEVSFDKVMRRIRGLSTGLSVNFMVIAQKVCSEIYDGVTTTELDNFAADICVSFITKHPDYGVLASRIVISNLHKSTPNSILTVVDSLYRNVDIVGAPAPLVSEKYYSIIKKKSAAIEAKIDYNRD